jgi:hypothetical protein
MATYTKRVQSRYENCSKRIQEEFIVCEVEIVVQDKVTGYITIETEEFRIPASLNFADSIAEFEIQRKVFDMKENE